MTDSHGALDAVERAAAELLPELTERLARHGLGEIEVADGELRLRVRARARPASEGPSSVAAGSAQGSGATAPPAAGRDAEPAPAAATAVPVGSPAVGFFVYADGLGPGLQVARGDAIGHVEMLGVRHEVRAPKDGTVRHLVAESGEAVEYGQTVVELEAEPAR